LKKNYIFFPILLLLMLHISGCSAVDEKNASLSCIYAAAAVIAVLLLPLYLKLARSKSVWFVLLFSAVIVVNVGYFLLSVSLNLEQALMANRLAYLGSVFLPLSMLMIIINVSNTEYHKWLPGVLICISFIVFLITASQGIVGIYYREVSFKVVDGVSTLVKEYGPLHPLYLVYLLGYFVSMVVVIIRASVRSRLDSSAHAVILIIAVFVNIGVWFIEQLCNMQFEMLSISYIISEMFLLGVHLMVSETDRLKELAIEQQSAQDSVPVETANAENMTGVTDSADSGDDERLKAFMNGIETLTKTERLIFEAYIARLTTKEIMAELNIKENTLKFHNKNIYSKLGVSSRKELVEIYKTIS